MTELIPVAVLQNRMTQANTNGITYFRRSRESLTEVPTDALAARVSSISRSSISACCSVRERSKARRAASFLPRGKTKREDSATKKLPTTKRRPGGRETQKMRRQAWSLKAKRVA